MLPLYLRMTLVQDYSTFWVDLKSEIIRELVPTTPGAPTIPTKKQSSTLITTPPGSPAATTRFNIPTQATATRVSENWKNNIFLLFKYVKFMKFRNLCSVIQGHNSRHLYFIRQTNKILNYNNSEYNSSPLFKK